MQKGSFSGDWYSGSKAVYNENPKGAANGSLMRNGVIPVLSASLSVNKALEYTILHSLPTHFSPLPAITCVLHTLLIRNALQRFSKKELPLQAPTLQDLQSLLQNEWKTFKEQYIASAECHEAVKDWYTSVTAQAVTNAEQQCMDELKDWEQWDPFQVNYSKISGYCVLYGSF